MTYDELLQALHLFGFHESDLLTIRRIKDRQRVLLKQSHPDLQGADSTERTRQINEAARLIMAYVNEYRFSFGREEFYRQCPEEHLRRQFAADPIWSGGSLEAKQQ
ncbi:molecular chaperone DnaJ [Trichlorobacter ammonificans]|uniref:Molecular chaperone DnaJ n=1 Tax=Trichlorobacter ammonificans TaxID=2916410 RepID=A0ABM9D8R2_9BACT|nr:molecular chaperone DnaJ [Trichlorobacter ammonificans]CAH2031612.1 conserved protein of unknown function [Trichlorobacter ammonificans]